MIQLFFNDRFRNYGINPRLVMHAFSFPKGTVRVEMVPHIQPIGGWDESRPRWDAGVPITTFMRKLALNGDWYADGGFYRLYDTDFSNLKED